MQGVPYSVQPHGLKVWCCPLQVGEFLTSIPSSRVKSWSLWHWWVGDMSMPQLWQGSTLPSSLMGDTRREDCVDDFLNFSGEEASLWDLPLWIVIVIVILNNEHMLQSFIQLIQNYICRKSTDYGKGKQGCRTFFWVMAFLHPDPSWFGVHYQGAEG